MSKHTNKYYQLIKILRTEKQMSTMRKNMRQERAQMMMEKANQIIDE
jgi:hypothetical protein